MIQAAWKSVACPTCFRLAGQTCKVLYGGRWFMGEYLIHDACSPHVARIAAGKAKRKGRNVSGSRARR